MLRRHLVIEKPTPWTLLPAQVDLVRAAVGRRRSRTAGRWRVKLQTGARSTICRQCGQNIPAGPRLRWTHLNIQSRRYDLRGDLHIDPEVCSENLLEAEFIAFQQQQWDDLSAEEQTDVLARDEWAEDRRELRE